MKRSSFKRASSRPTWQRPRKKKRDAPLVPKRLGKMLIDKGPIRDRAHRVRVAQHPCLICRTTFVHSHHIRECYPRTMGVRIGDNHLVPLCVLHHAELHTCNNDSFWRRHHIDAKKWASDFYAETLRLRGPSS